MTDGDIQFGDIENRPIEEGRRPDQDRKFAVVAYGNPEDDDIPVFISLDAFADIETHAHSDTSVELGGVMLGKQHVDDRGKPFIWVTDSLRAKHYDSSISRFTYTAETWTEINREQQEVAPDLDIVGWYHTHPGWGIFLSGHDTFIHENYFAQPLDTAYVVDPVNNDRGFFCWRSDGDIRSLPQMGGYYVAAPREQRAALEDIVARVEGRRLAEHSGGGGGGGQPIIVQTAPGGRGLLAGAAFAVLILLVMTQLGVMLSMYTRLLETPNSKADAEKLALAAKNEEYRNALARLNDLEKFQIQLAGERETLRSMVGDLKIGEEPFIKRYEALADDARKERERAALAEGRSKVVTDAALAIHQEKEFLKGELERSKKQVDGLLAQKARNELLEVKNAELKGQVETLMAAAKKNADESEKYRADLDRWRDNKDKLDSLDAYREESRQWYLLTMFAAVPLAAVGWGASLVLYRRLAAARAQISDLTAKPPTDGDARPPAAEPSADSNGAPPTNPLAGAKPADEVRID